MPPKDQDVFKVSSKLAVTVIGVLLAGAISFNAWAVSSMFDRPTESEVIELIKVHSPYNQDRKLILEALRRVEKDNSEIKTAILDNTKTVVELKALLTKDK